MGAVSIIIILILLGVIGVMAYLMFKSKRPIIGKATIPKSLQEAQIMEMLGESNAKLDEYKKTLDSLLKQKEFKVSVNDEIKKRLIEEKKKILKEGVKLYLNPTQYKIVGIDGTNYGDFLSLVLSENGEKVWIYYNKGEIIDIIGGKPLQEIIRHIDKEQKIIFIQYDKNQRLIPKQYEKI